MIDKPMGYLEIHISLAISFIQFQNDPSVVGKRKFGHYKNQSSLAMFLYVTRQTVSIYWGFVKSLRGFSFTLLPGLDIES